MSFIDKLNRWLGHAVAWFTLVMVIITFCNVVSRYLFNEFSIALSELVLAMNAMVFLLSAPLLLYTDKHVRVDVLYSRMGLRKKGMVDLFGTVFLLWSFCGFILYYSWDYVASSWRLKEASPEVGGIPGLFLIKSLIVLMACLMILQGISMIAHKLKQIKTQQPHPESPTSENNQPSLSEGP